MDKSSIEIDKKMDTQIFDKISWSIIENYFHHNPHALVQHHIESYNDFFENGVSIYSARINTLGERVEDTFEIENLNKKLVPNYKIKKIISELRKIV